MVPPATLSTIETFPPGLPPVPDQESGAAISPMPVQPSTPVSNVLETANADDAKSVREAVAQKRYLGGKSIAVLLFPFGPSDLASLSVG